jgi:hypothetical protein
MKLFLLILYVLFVGFYCQAQNIADVTITRSNEWVVRDINNKRISGKYFSSSHSLAGFSNSIILIRTSGNELIVYDVKFKRISSKYVTSHDQVRNVIGNTILIKTRSGEIITYDQRWKRISSRYE